MSTATFALPVAPKMDGARNLRIFATETRYEFLRALRTRAFSLSVIGFPLMFYTLFGLVMNHGEVSNGVSIPKYMLGGYATFGMVGASLFGIGVGLSNELAAGWLELKRASPMPAMAYLLAKCASAMAFAGIIVSLLCLEGIAFGGVHLSLVEYAKMMALALVGSVPFASMGLLLAQLVPATSAPGIANMIYLPMSFLSGLWLPVNMLPKALQAVAPVLPAYHLAQLMESIFGYEQRSHSITGHWFGLVAFTVVMLVCSRFAFRRMEQNA